MKIKIKESKLNQMHNGIGDNIIKNKEKSLWKILIDIIKKLFGM